MHLNTFKCYKFSLLYKKNLFNPKKCNKKLQKVSEREKDKNIKREKERERNREKEIEKERERKREKREN